MHVPVHAAQEGGQADGRTDQRGPGAHEVPERLPAGRTLSRFSDGGEE